MDIFKSLRPLLLKFNDPEASSKQLAALITQNIHKIQTNLRDFF